MLGNILSTLWFSWLGLFSGVPYIDSDVMAIMTPAVAIWAFISLIGYWKNSGSM